MTGPQVGAHRGSQTGTPGGSQEPPLRIGVLTGHNPHDRNSFSGTPYYMMKALERRPDATVQVLGNHRPGPRSIPERVWRRIRPRPAFSFDPATVDVDMVLAPVASGLVARHADALPCPVLFLTDATPAFLREFYGHVIPPEADRIEAEALAAAAGSIYSSRYMADRALVEFPGTDPARVHALPFGINLDHLPDAVPAKPPLDELRLLFIGQDWARKGGAIALATLERLLDLGVRARLSVIGSSSPEADAHPAVDVLGYLDKNDPAEARRFVEALKATHLFLLPTRADCTPMVVAEVNAYGCPVLITDTGGIGSLMAEGVNGRMLPLEAGPDAWAEAVRDLTADPTAYGALCASSFRHAHERLSWDAWADGIMTIARSIPGLQERRAG